MSINIKMDQTSIELTKKDGKPPSYELTQLPKSQSRAVPKLQRQLSRTQQFQKQLSNVAVKTQNVVRTHTHGEKYVRSYSLNQALGTSRRTSMDSKRYYQRYSCTPNCDSENGNFPIFSLAVMLVSILFFCLYNSIGKILGSPWHFRGRDTIYKECWRFITYAFVHADLSHILSNLVLFCISCSMIEIAHGSLRAIAIFLTGVQRVEL